MLSELVSTAIGPSRPRCATMPAVPSRPMMPPAEDNRDDYCSKGESFAVAWQVGNPPAASKVDRTTRFGNPFQPSNYITSTQITHPAPCVLN